MRLGTYTRRTASWLAALALLVAACAPAWAHVLSAGAGDAWIEVCSTSGSKWLKADKKADDGQPAQSSLHLSNHCAYCSLHSGDLALPPTQTGVFFSLLLAHETPILFLAAKRTGHAWVAAQPRAPPSDS